MRWKRPLFLFHRWAGIVLCLFFALWFLSGIFMMYVEFPQLTAPESRAGQRTLDFSSAQLTPAQAVARLNAGHFALAATPSVMRRRDVGNPDASITAMKVQLAMLLDRPVYRIYVADAQPRTVFADNGEVLRGMTPELARRVATDFAVRCALLAAPASWKVRYEDATQTDQWTVSAGLNAHRPLHRISLGDESDTQLYVSSTTGAVVRDTHWLERALNYAGAVTHWLYPTFIRRYPDAWEWIVDILSAAGTLLAVSGLWIGIMRWRRKRNGSRAATPYRGLMRWHHLTGLAFGLTAITWVLSGLLSMNPLNINPSRAAAEQEALAFSGKALTPADFTTAPAQVLGSNVTEAELVHYDNQPFYKATTRDGAVKLVHARGSQARLPNIAVLLAHGGALMPDARVGRAYALTDYDDYYYTRHPERGDKPLPIVRVQFRDDQETWFHIDAVTGQVLDRSTRFNRVYRWLYNGLHSWDIRWLWERRPLWDIAVITFCLGGLILSLIGVIAGVRRLRWELGIVPLAPRQDKSGPRSEGGHAVRATTY